MTDNTNIEADIPAFMAQYRKEHPESAEYSDAKIQYNLDRGWILGWCMARRATISNTEPTAYRVTMPNGKERGVYSNYADVEISISNLEGNIITPLFLRPSMLPLSETRIKEIIDSIKYGDGWDGEIWNITIARAVEKAHNIHFPFTNTEEEE